MLLPELLNASARLHRHLCPRQVLGVRMGLLAGELLNLPLPPPSKSKRLLTIVETDGCLADGIAVATNCWVGRRTLRVEDYGKVAATFVDTQTQRALRIIPRRQARSLAHAYAPEAHSRWEAMLLGYQCMPGEELFSVQAVELSTPVEKVVSHAGCKTQCELCGEEIINEREVWVGGKVLCRSCAGESYYQVRNKGQGQRTKDQIPNPKDQLPRSKDKIQTISNHKSTINNPQPPTSAPAPNLPAY